MNNERFAELSPVMKHKYKEQARELLEYLKCQYGIIPDLYFGDWAGGCSTHITIDEVVDAIGKTQKEVFKKLSLKYEDG